MRGVAHDSVLRAKLIAQHEAGIPLSLLSAPTSATTRAVCPGYRAHDLSGLEPRSRRPHRSPTRHPAACANCPGAQHHRSDAVPRACARAAVVSRRGGDDRQRHDVHHTDAFYSNRLTRFEQALQSAGIEHRLIRPRSPESNGTVERILRRGRGVTTVVVLDSQPVTRSARSQDQGPP